MQLISLRLGAIALACAALLAAVALPAPHAAAQSSEGAAISSEREAERYRIGRAILELIPRIGEERERKIRYLRRTYASGAAREDLDALIAWIEEIESGDPRIMYDTALRLRDGAFPRHWQAALTWLERVGDHGVPEGYHAAARMRLGQPNPVLEWEGEALLRRAARHGVAAAQKEMATRELARVEKIERNDYGPYAWLLLAEANGAEVSDDEFAAARDNLSRKRRKYTRAIVQQALGKSRLPRFWPSIRHDDPADNLKEDMRAALRWHECGRALSIIDDARRAGIAAAEHELSLLRDNGKCAN